MTASSTPRAHEEGNLDQVGFHPPGVYLMDRCRRLAQI